MKITTWNINGLRAALDKGIWTWVEAYAPDVLCLQEIKARPEQLSEQQQALFAGQHALWNPAERPGYSGVVTFSRQPPEQADLGLGIAEFDVEGRVARTRQGGFLLYNIYFPNGQRGQERVDYKLEFYARLLEICDHLHAQGEKVVICGDFNTAHNEIDLKNPKENQHTSGFLPEERVWIDHYLAHGFVDVYRHLYPDRVQYTWWTYRFNARPRNIGWRLDYFLVSPALVPQVQDVIVHEEVLGSDHCPVTLLIE
ncbi:MAG: exodeoxyribonuclease III [Anaerolineales bacterium]|nr:exodeoxyribonuclease III [Anaerolineales bacterium]